MDRNQQREQEIEAFEREMAKLEAGREPEPAKGWIISLAAGVAGASPVYRLLVSKHLGGTSAMFIGIPSILAIALAFTPRARSVTGGILKAITFMLLIVAPILGEGWFCILIASPLFYVVGLIVGLIADHNRRKRNRTVTCLALFLLPMCLEGVVPALTFDRYQTVEVTRTIAATPEQVEQSLARVPRVSEKLPLLLRIGFPVPLSATGGGIALGDQRSILFSGVESAPPGSLLVRVGARRPGYLRFDALSDASKLDHWLHWQSAEVAWSPLDPTHTRITCRMHFERRLDPAWYFVPWERAAVHEAVSYLIQTGAAPAGAGK